MTGTSERELRKSYYDLKIGELAADILSCGIFSVILLVEAVAIAVIGQGSGYSWILVLLLSLGGGALACVAFAARRELHDLRKEKRASLDSLTP